VARAAAGASVARSASHTSYLAGEIAQCGFWFPPSRGLAAGARALPFSADPVGARIRPMVDRNGVALDITDIAEYLEHGGRTSSPDFPAHVTILGH
jgi:hypothetical protein